MGLFVHNVITCQNAEVLSHKSYMSNITKQVERVIAIAITSTHSNYVLCMSQKRSGRVCSGSEHKCVFIKKYVGRGYSKHCQLYTRKYCFQTFIIHANPFDRIQQQICFQLKKSKSKLIGVIANTINSTHAKNVFRHSQFFKTVRQNSTNLFSIIKSKSKLVGVIANTLNSINIRGNKVTFRRIGYDGCQARTWLCNVCNKSIYELTYMCYVYITF